MLKNVLHNEAQILYPVYKYNHLKDRCLMCLHIMGPTKTYKKWYVLKIKVDNWQMLMNLCWIYRCWLGLRRSCDTWLCGWKWSTTAYVVTFTTGPSTTTVGLCRALCLLRGINWDVEGVSGMGPRWGRVFLIGKDFGKFQSGHVFWGGP